jgi:alpha-amylase
MAALAIAATLASAQDNPVILEWFETPWQDMEHRIPDLFEAGYGAVWLPPVSKGSDQGSAGYNVFDRFDLGSPTGPTAYGTEQGFRAVVDELHESNGLVYIDAIMNHNSFRNSSVTFQEQGGWPGFWLNPEDPPRDKLPTDDWGDFHNGTASGYYQSEDPGGARYDLFIGDLVALVDIAQESNNQFIRQPVQEGDPNNIPAGTVYNIPDPDNARFYPDRDLTPFTFTNPGAHGHGSLQFTIYPYNTADPLQGDPVTDNTTGLLMRWTQWMVDEIGVDGFRLDAAKHIPNWFWDLYWDSAVYKRRTAPSGLVTTPFSFVESVESNSWTYSNYVRKGDGFGNRDALDLNGAGQLRDINNAGGFGHWQNVLNAHIDNEDDGFNNGSLGVNHVFSHDNGSTGDGSSQPPDPNLYQQALPEHAYLLMRPGRAVVYHNALGVSRSGGFWPRQGLTQALGLDYATGSLDDSVTTLVKIHNQYARGEFYTLNSTDPVNQSLADVMVFDLKTSGVSNVLVGVNDRWDAGVEQRNVLTGFPADTRLHELTGNADDPAIDPSGQIPSVLVVGGDQRVTITIPNNASTAGDHGKGYVIYGPAVPAGELTLTNTSSTIPADPPQAPGAKRRLTEVPVIAADNFSIVLTTTQADPLDPNTDDNAVFRFDQGYVDSNGNGSVDHLSGELIIGGYEDFLTTNQPLYGSGLSEGLYVQNISSLQMAEGYHYLSVIAFRHRDAGAPLFREFRRSIYIDREGPAVAWTNETSTIPDTSYLVQIKAMDRTTNRVHVMWDLPGGTDPIDAADALNMASKRDRFDWEKTLVGLTDGWHTLTIVAFEVTDNASVQEFDVFVGQCPPDFNGDTVLNSLDFIAFLNAFTAGDPSADYNNDGAVNSLDFISFLNDFVLGC